MKLSIPDMSCGHCKASVMAALSPLASAIAVDLDARQVELTTPANAQTDGPAILAALAKIGFPAEILAP